MGFISSQVVPEQTSDLGGTTVEPALRPPRSHAILDGKLLFQQLVTHKFTEEERVADSAWLQNRSGKPTTKFKRTRHNDNYLRVKSFPKSHKGFESFVESHGFFCSFVSCNVG